MKLKVFSSGSEGNGYLLTAKEGDALVIEAGVPSSSILREIKRDRISGLIVSHAHGDHAGRLQEYLDMRIDTRIHDESLHAIKKEITGYFFPLFFEEGMPFKLGKYEIISFRLKHDTPCFGFLIRHPDMKGNLLFCTDTANIPYTFDNVQNIMIEADYDTTILKNNIESGKINAYLGKRICKTHYSINQAIQFCKNRDLSKVRNIILLHLSKNNSSKDEFRKRMIEETGKPVYIAETGLEIEIGNNPF